MPKNLESHKANKGGALKRRRALRAGREEGAGDGSDYRQRIRANKVASGSKKNGCLPKLFMLVVPLIAVGAYLILGL
jgi:hypothetical protein